MILSGYQSKDVCLSVYVYLSVCMSLSVCPCVCTPVHLSTCVHPCMFMLVGSWDKKGLLLSNGFQVLMKGLGFIL